MQVSSWQGQNTKFPQLVAVTVVDYNHHPIKLNYLSSRIGFMGLSSYVLAVLAMIHPASAWLIPSELPLMWCSISVATWSQPSPVEMARMDGVLYREDVMTGDFTHQVHERPQWPTTSCRCGGDHICGWSWYHMTYESYEQHRRRGSGLPTPGGDFMRDPDGLILTHQPVGKGHLCKFMAMVVVPSPVQQLTCRVYEPMEVDTRAHLRPRDEEQKLAGKAKGGKMWWRTVCERNLDIRTGGQVWWC